MQTANTTVRLKAMPFQSELLNEFFPQSSKSRAFKIDL